ncbi:hypothetical protein LY13_001857 [Prauserella aidingensis]|nr:hypothetical protein [Prauserella aidingensis]MCP2253109.1 hypothetical protein [Prauserella aidingensis]
MTSGGCSSDIGKAGLTVLAVDKNFELIAEITGQPVEMLALR